MSAEQDLFVAVGRGNLTEAIAALERGANVNWKNEVDGRTALLRAARNGYCDVAALLVERGADPNIADNLGEKPLDVARRMGHDDIVSLLEKPVTALFDQLVEMAASGDLQRFNAYLATAPAELRLSSFLHPQSGDTLLHALCRTGQVDAVVSVVRSCADINILNKNGVTCLVVAIMGAQDDIVEFLLLNGVDTTLIDNAGKRAIDYARGLGQQRSLVFLEALSDASTVDLETLHLQAGDALLHVLCSNGRIDAAAALLTRGVPINALNKWGTTALYHASMNRGGTNGLSASRRPRIEEGSKVEANYRGKGKYYPGRIKRDRGDGTFDIDYDDGEFEMQVPEDMIRLLDERVRRGGRGSGGKAAALEVGDKVEANYKGLGKWFPGKIKRMRFDGSCDIVYDDGKIETSLSADLVRAKGISKKAARIEEGSKVEANYRGKGKYYPGRIKRDRGDGTFDIDYDDGEKEVRVPEDMIRLLDSETKGSSTDFIVGASVEGNYKGRGKWYPGKIKRLRADGTYDIDYDGGELELQVLNGMIRFLNGNPELVAFLLERGADTDLADKEGKKPVDVAAEKGLVDVVSLLSKWAALRKLLDMIVSGDLQEFDATLDSLSGASLFELSFLKTQTQSRKVAENTLPDRYDRILTRLGTLSSIYQLQESVLSGNLDGFDAALAALPDATPTVLAAIHPKSGESLLHLLCSRGYHDAVVSLLKMGVNINSLNKLGTTALYRVIINAKSLEGSRVEANFRGKGKYYPGRIKRDRGDGTFDIDYDDGEKEVRVPKDMVFFDGAVVEGNYKGLGKWNPGKIRRLRADGTFDIDYDDGEVEMRVSGDMIRLLDAVEGILELVVFLLERGADPDLADMEGKKPVDVAAEKGRADIVSLLTKWTALRKLLDMIVSGDLKEFDTTLDLLIGASLFELSFLQTQTKGSKVAESASQNGYDKILARLETQSTFYQLQESVLSGNLDGFDAALAALSDATPTVLAAIHPKSGESLLHLLCSRGHQDAVVSLLKMGVDINSLNKGGTTALYHVIMNANYLIEEGSKVEANFRGKGKYYPGRIKRDRGDGMFDIDYDDGEQEMRVPEDMIRLLDEPVRRGGRGSGGKAAALEVGDKVEANYKGRGKWFPGKIKRMRFDGSCDIDYDDGEIETAVSADLVRAVGISKKAARIEEGSKVEANYRGKGKYFPGYIKRDRGDGTFDIDYNDGEQEMRVPEDMIRLLDAVDGGGAKGLSASRRPRIQEGSKVEANFRGKGKYYPGRIKRDRGDGMFDIDYDDGEFEMRVPEDMIRLLDAVDCILEVVALLLERGADPDLANKEGKKPVDVATEKGRADIVSLLKKWAAFNKLLDMIVSGDLQEFDATLDSLSGASLFELSLLQTQTQSRKVAENTLPDRYDRILTRLETLSSIYQLQESVLSGNLDGFDAALVALPDATPTVLAAIHSKLGESLLHLLCSRGYHDAVVSLLKMGANINSLNKRGSTCLTAATVGGHYAVVEILLRSGADISTSYTTATTPDNIRHLLDRTRECLMAARDGHGVASFSQLYKLEAALVAGAIPNATIGLQEAALGVGDKVEAKYKGGSKWFLAKIKRVQLDGSYDIEYDDDGNVETAVSADLVRGVGRGGIEEGSRVESNFEGKGKFYSGRVKIDRGDGTYDIEYDDGGKEMRVLAERIRLPGSHGSSGGKAVGCWVEANFKGRGKWFPGKIKSIQVDGSYDIDYDDGEVEKAVSGDLVRTVGKTCHNALFYALGLHRTPERRSHENIAAVACLLSRNADFPILEEGEPDLLSQPWSPTLKGLLEEALKLKASGQVILYRADLIVVGNGASGKTTLLHRMKLEEFLTGATMTDGIDMTNLRIGQVYFAGRDAAGQPIYAHTISLFFKEDAIYLAVFNPRVENNLDALTEFLHMVRNSSPLARVVLATTRSDEAEMDGIMLADLRRRFPMICGVFPVDSFSGHGVDSLRQCLLQEALTRPSTRHVVSAALPRTIDRIVRYAEEHRDTFSVSREQLREIMGEPDLSAEEQTRLMDQLVSFGTIHNLSGGPSSDPVFILRPQQLADVYACVVTKNPITLTRVKRLSKEGILDHADDALKSVWGMYPEALWRCTHDGDSSENGSGDRLSLFLRLLHDSGLAYEVFDMFGRPQGRSIVPCLLPEKPAGFDGDVSDDSELLRHFVPDYVRTTSLSLEQLHVSFSSMPFTFFAQLLAGLRKIATDGGAWRNGAVLSAGVSFALLREGRSGISISLLGKNRSVRSVILLTVLQVMQKFSSMAISRVGLVVAEREWCGDDIEEALHDGHGVLYSTKIKSKVEVHSLWMLFPQGDTMLSSSDISSTIASSEQLSLLQRTVQRAKAAKSMDFIVLVNRYLQNCVPILLQLMGAPRLPLQGDDLPRPLWVVLQHRVNGILSFCAMPFFPHYVPDEPWIALEAAQFPFTPVLQTAYTGDSSASGAELELSTLLTDCFSTMRGSMADMLPSGWELSPTQSLTGADLNLMVKREKDYFMCVDGTVFSKEFAAKAQAMKTVSLGQYTPPPEQFESGQGGAVQASETMPGSDGITVEAIRSFFDEHVDGKMKADCTTADILPLVKSLTKGNGSGGAGRSYCQWLKQKTAESSSSSCDQVGPATVFISHAWKYSFHAFLLALEARFKGKRGMLLWIDNFCHNQHEDLTSDAWVTIFEKHIKRINNTVMILFPWNNPIPFTRAWCLLEVFYNTKNGVPFEVYLTEEQRRQFLEFAQRDPGQAMLIFSRISTRQSTCWVLNDQLRIHSLIESSVGFEAVDEQVREAIARALQVDHTSSCLTSSQQSQQTTEKVSVGSMTMEKKESLVKWLRDNEMLKEEKVPTSIDVILHYD